MDAGSVDPWRFGTACEPLPQRVQSVSRGLHDWCSWSSARAGSASTSLRSSDSCCCLCDSLFATGGASDYKPIRNPTDPTCSKLGRQIAVDLEADAHFDQCRSCP